jgi:hypothetical protein
MEKVEKVLTWDIEEVGNEAEDMLEGWIEGVTPVLENDRYYYFKGEATWRADNYEEGERVLLRVAKYGNEEGFDIEGCASEDGSWFFLNFVHA